MTWLWNRADSRTTRAIDWHKHTVEVCLPSILHIVSPIQTGWDSQSWIVITWRLLRHMRRQVIIGNSQYDFILPKHCSQMSRPTMQAGRQTGEKTGCITASSVHISSSNVVTDFAQTGRASYGKQLWLGDISKATLARGTMRSIGRHSQRVRNTLAHTTLGWSGVFRCDKPAC